MRAPHPPTVNIYHNAAPHPGYPQDIHRQNARKWLICKGLLNVGTVCDFEAVDNFGGVAGKERANSKKCQ